jgi:hypothetical protein
MHFASNDVTVHKNASAEFMREPEYSPRHEDGGPFHVLFFVEGGKKRVYGGNMVISSTKP